jgi:hypothetical protein
MKNNATKKPYYPSMLSVQADAKTSKGIETTKVLTGILYMAPSDSSDIANVCAYATAGCKLACLGWFAGRVKVFTQIKKSRIRRVEMFKYEREKFFQLVVKDIKALIRKAAREGLTPVVRLNGSSDIPYERLPVTVDGIKYPNIMAAFSDVGFYDYTKYPYDKRPTETLPPNYDLTYSHAEGRLAESDRNLANGRRVAMVFRKPETATKWRQTAIVDGDGHDYRPSDPQGVIVALKAKGDAKHDQSGFVLDALPA